MAFMVNVPDVAGVPDVLFGDDDILGVITALADDLITEIAPGGAQWGLFSGGSPVVIADSVIALDYKQEWSISDYPVEGGAFQSYNKVALPFDVRIRFTAGSASGRDDLLSSIASIAGTTQLFDAVTPDVVYPSVNITHYDYRRTARNGVGLLQVDVWCLQVNVSDDDLLGGSSQPDGSPQTNGGTVQTTTPTPSQSAAVAAAPDLNAEGAGLD